MDMFELTVLLKCPVCVICNLEYLNVEAAVLSMGAEVSHELLAS